MMIDDDATGNDDAMMMIVMMILTITVIRVLTRSSDKTKSSILLSSCPAYHANLCIANLSRCKVCYYYTGPILLRCYTSIHNTSPIMFLLSAPPFRLVSVIDVDSSIKCDYDPLPPLQTLPLPLQNCHQLDQCHRFENRDILSSYLREYKR